MEHHREEYGAGDALGMPVRPASSPVLPGDAPEAAADLPRAQSQVYAHGRGRRETLEGKAFDTEGIDPRLVRLWCPAGHGVGVYRARTIFFCSVCAQELPRGTWIKRCKPCDWDLCPDCESAACALRASLEDVLYEGGCRTPWETQLWREGLRMLCRDLHWRRQHLLAERRARARVTDGAPNVLAAVVLHQQAAGRRAVEGQQSHERAGRGCGLLAWELRGRSSIAAEEVLARGQELLLSPPPAAPPLRCRASTARPRAAAAAAPVPTGCGLALQALEGGGRRGLVRAEAAGRWALTDASCCGREEDAARGALERDEDRSRAVVALGALAQAAAAPLPLDRPDLAALASMAAAAGLGFLSPGEGRAAALVSAARSEAERAQAFAELNAAAPPCSSLAAGLAGAVAAGPGPASPHSLEAAAAEQRRGGGAGAQGPGGFEAKQLDGLRQPHPAVLSREPAAVAARRAELRPAYPRDWALPSPPPGELRPAADALAGALDALVAAISAGQARGVPQRAVSFLLDLPTRLGEALPETRKWLTDEHISTTLTYAQQRKYATQVLHRPGTWARRDTGQVWMLRDVALRLSEQVRWVAGHSAWDLSEADLAALVRQVKAGDGLSQEQLEALCSDARDLVHVLRVLLLNVGVDDAVDLFCAAFLYTTNLHRKRLPADWDHTVMPNPRCQIFYVWNRALREWCDPHWPFPVTAEATAAHERVVQLFAPMSWLLSSLLRMVATPALVSRGIKERVSQHYTMGTVLPLCSFASHSYDDSQSVLFAGEAGTWFKMQGLSGAPLGFASPFPKEREMLFPCGTMTEVGFKFGHTLLLLLNCPLDIVFLAEWRSDPPPVEEIVDLRCKMLRSVRTLFSRFLSEYVPHHLASVQDTSGAPVALRSNALFDVFRDFLDSPDVHVLVLEGDGGTGKSAACVALSYLVAETTGWVPIFDGLHQIEGLLERGGEGAARRGCIAAHIKAKVLQCADADAAYESLTRHSIVLIGDSLDETFGTLPQGCPLLRFGGVRPSPSYKVVISVRSEYLREQHVAMGDLHDGAVWRCALRAFTAADCEQLARNCAALHAEGMEGDLDPVIEALGAISQSDPEITGSPFTAKMTIEMALAGTGSPAHCLVTSERRSGAGELRWQLYSGWMELHVQQQRTRFAALRHLASRRLLNYAGRVGMALALLLVLRGEWHGRLGSYLRLLSTPSSIAEPEFVAAAGISAGDAAELAEYFSALVEPPCRQFAREMVGCLPVRVENLDCPGAQFQFRHKTIIEFLVAQWFLLACSEASEGRRVPRLLAIRFLQGRCSPSQELVVGQLLADPGLPTLLGAAAAADRHREAEPQRADCERPPGEIAAVEAGTEDSEAGGFTERDADMFHRLQRLSWHNDPEDPVPPLPSLDWVQQTLAVRVFQHVAMSGQSELTRRQLSSIVRRWMLGRTDAPLTDDEWMAERNTKGEHAGAPSVLQGADRGLGRPAGAQRRRHQQGVSCPELGAWLRELTRWVGESSARLAGGTAHQWACGLVRLVWGLYSAQTASLPNAARQLLTTALRRYVWYGKEARRPRELAAVARLAAAGAECDAVCGPRHAAPLYYLCRGAMLGAAEPTAAFAVAVAALATETALAQDATWAALRRIWPGCPRDGAELVGEVAERARDVRVDEICSAARAGAGRLTLSARGAAQPGSAAGLNLSAEQLRRVLGAAAAAGRCNEVDCSDNARLEPAGWEALVHFVAECPSVQYVDLRCSSAPAEAQIQLFGLCEARGGLCDCTERRVRDLCAHFERGGQCLGLFAGKRDGSTVCDGQLLRLAGAARCGGAVLTRIDLERTARLSPRGWEELLALVADCRMVRFLRLMWTSAPNQLRRRLQHIVTAREGTYLDEVVCNEVDRVRCWGSRPAGGRLAGLRAAGAGLAAVEEDDW